MRRVSLTRERERERERASERASHDDQRILEGNHAALGVGQAAVLQPCTLTRCDPALSASKTPCKASEAVLQNLKHEIEHIWVRLLDLVEKDEASDY